MAATRARRYGFLASTLERVTRVLPGDVANDVRVHGSCGAPVEFRFPRRGSTLLDSVRNLSS